MELIRLTFTGDILIEPEQYKAVCCHPDGFDTIFENLKSSFSLSSYVIGNLETPLAGEELIYSNHKWSFNTPDSLAESLKRVGFDLVTTANNHCLDRGKIGLLNTIKVLDQYGIEHIGTYASKVDREKVFIKKIGGLRFAFLSYTYGTNAAFNGEYLGEDSYMVNLFQSQERKDPLKKQYITRAINKFHDILAEKSGYYWHALSQKKQICKDIEKCRRENVDYIIMCMHCGGQYNKAPDPYTLSLVEWLSKKGVDFIIGNHPHVIHLGKKISGKKITVYSLGNLCSYSKSETAYHENDNEVLADYSIILHLNFCKEEDTVEFTFEIYKSIVDSDKVSRVYPLYDLICKEKDFNLKAKLLSDNEFVVRKFTNKKDHNVKLLREYKF